MKILRKHAGHFLLGSLAGVLVFVLFSLSASPVSAADSFAIATSCPYYSFGTISVSAYPSALLVSPGTDLSFKSTVSNANPYAITDASYFVVLNYLSASGTMPIEISQSQTVNRVDIPAQGATDLSFAVSIPASAPKGRYRADVYVVASGFDMDVANRTESSPDGEALFAVTGGNGLGAYAMPGLGVKETSPDPYAPIILTATLENPTSKSVTVLAKWKSYSGFTPNQAAFVGGASQAITLPARSSTTTSYTLTDASYPFYDVVLDANAAGLDSFAEAQPNRAIPSAVPVLITATSTKAGIATVEGCIYSGSSGNASSSPLSVELSVGNSQSAAQIAQSYVSGFQKTVGAGYVNPFVVAVTVKGAGPQLETMSASYGCARYPGLCSGSQVSQYIVYIYVTFGAILVALLVAIWEMRRKSANRL